jgi:hypothetical protein
MQSMGSATCCHYYYPGDGKGEVICTEGYFLASVTGGIYRQQEVWLLVHWYYKEKQGTFNWC